MRRGATQVSYGRSLGTDECVGTASLTRSRRVAGLSAVRESEPLATRTAALRAAAGSLDPAPHELMRQA